MRYYLKSTLMVPLLLGTLVPAFAQDNTPATDASPATETQPANNSQPTTEAQPPTETQPPADNHNDDIHEVTSGKTLPLTLNLNELGNNWRQLTINSQIETDKKVTDLDTGQSKTEFDGEMQKLVSLLASGPGVYFTQGQTVTTGNDSFLVAYHTPFDADEFKALFKPQGKQPTQDEVTQTLEKYLRSRVLDLTLLNLRLVGSMSNIRPFNMNAQIEKVRAFVASTFERDAPRAVATSETPATHPPKITAPPANLAPAAPATTPATTANEATDASTANLQQLGAGLKMYLEDNDGVLPPMKDAATVKAALKVFVNESLFMQPTTHEAYLPNPILSDKKLAHITNPAAMVAFYEANPDANGKRALLFLDGHVKRIKEAEWPLVKRASRIP